LPKPKPSHGQPALQEEALQFNIERSYVGSPRDATKSLVAQAVGDARRSKSAAPLLKQKVPSDYMIPTTLQIL